MVTATAGKATTRSTLLDHAAAAEDADDELSFPATTKGVCEGRHGRGILLHHGGGGDGAAPSRIGATAEDRFDGGGGDDLELKEVRERLMAHLREAANRMGLAVGAGSAAAVDLDEAAVPETRTRSLRPRRTAAWRKSSAQTSRRRRFSVPLMKEEIDEDFYAVTGKLPRRRPTKRPRALQKQLDMLFPGSWLTEITVETYKLTGGPLP